jgi:hypothetical protein
MNYQYSCNGRYTCKLNIQTVSENFEIKRKFEENLEKRGIKKDLYNI